MSNYKTAKEAGERHYSTGKPCRNGHTALRFTSSRQCMECQRLRTLKYSRSKKGKENGRKKHLSRYYGTFSLQVEGYQECMICKVKLSQGVGKTGRCVDHNHRTGKIRGVLCNNCNRALGLFGDSERRLLAALEYLKNSEEFLPDAWITKERRVEKECSTGSKRSSSKRSPPKS